MDESAERLLKNFIDAANKQTPHATDWRRFYDFLIAVHRQGLDASEGEVGNMIWAARFHPDLADKFQTVFTRGLDLLKRFEETGSSK